MTIRYLDPGWPCGMRDSWRGLLGLLVLLLPFGYPAGAQERDVPSSPEVGFGEEIDVRVVNLEVVVEDRAGNRVEGLTSSARVDVKP